MTVEYTGADMETKAADAAPDAAETAAEAPAYQALPAADGKRTHSPSLVLGIISIPGAFLAYGIVGLVCGIIAIVLARKNRMAYNTKIGFITGVIGLVLSIIVLIVSVVAYMAAMAALSPHN